MKNTMTKTTQAMNAFLNDDSGQTLIEYALVAGLIGLGAVIALTSLGTKISAAFTSLGNSLSSAL